MERVADCDQFGGAFQPRRQAKAAQTRIIPFQPFFGGFSGNCNESSLVITTNEILVLEPIEVSVVRGGVFLQRDVEHGAALCSAPVSTRAFA